MSAGAYWFERFACLSFGIPLLYTAIYATGYFQHLTYWALTLHTVYFTVDKASPHASTAIRALHGFSLCGAVAVLIGYSLISIFGKIHFGTWIAWENAVGAHAGTVEPGSRTLLPCATQKLYEHLWPCIALLLDAYFSRDVLRRVYAGARPVRNALFSMGLFLLLGTIWEHT